MKQERKQVTREGELQFYKGDMASPTYIYQSHQTTGKASHHYLLPLNSTTIILRSYAYIRFIVMTQEVEILFVSHD